MLYLLIALSLYILATGQTQKFVTYFVGVKA